MNNIFCAEESCQAKEDPIGTAFNRRYYVLLEVPLPWTPDLLESKNISNKLQNLNSVIDEASSYLRLLFIYNANYYQSGKNRLIIYYQTEEISSGYSKKEYILSDIDDAVPIIQKCIKNETLESENTNIQTRDFLVCTHGSHDKCCAKYGNPFYRQALATIEDLSLSHVRVWQCSHFGGHRFAPTMIDLPEGRYYARLDQKIFTSILTKTGDIQCLKNIYRGWGILPWQVQILERELMLKYNWDWFNYQIQGHVIEQNEDETFSQVEITFTTPDSKVNTYRCNVIDDPTKSISFRGECGTNELVTFSQYTITELVDMATSLIAV